LSVNPMVRDAGRRVRNTLRAVVRDVQRPPLYPPGHYYSPNPSVEDIKRALTVSGEPAGVDLHAEEQLTLARNLDLRFPAEGRWGASNEWFRAADAAVLRAMLLHVRPTSVVEVGSGHSTAVILDTADSDLPGLSLTCIEPHADRLRSLLRPGDRVRLIERPVQDVAPQEIASMVSPGGFLFIDSTHVAKPGSDVLHLMLDTLPLLPVGTFVHLHDIFWPFEYPEDWLREGRYWNELYFLRAFLSHNTAWQVLLFNSWLWSEHPEAVPHELLGYDPCSVWLRRVAD
jgi:hypothetical protein